MATVELVRKQAGPGPLFVFYASSAALLVCMVVSINTLLSDHRLIGTFWASGSALAKGGDPYAKYPLTWHTDLFLHGVGRVTFYDLNLNPPATLPIFHLLSHLPISSLAIGWSILSALSMVGGVALLFKGLQLRQILWMLLAFAVQETLAFGTYYSFLFFLSCVCLCFIRSQKTIAAGVAIGVLVAIKPNLGLWPVMLLISGYKRCAWVSTLIAAGFSLIPLALYGPAIYSLWLHAFSGAPHYIFAADTSIIGIFSRLGFPHTGFTIAIILACLLLLVVKRSNEINIAGVAICAGILCSPLGWFEYSMFAAPFFVAKRWGRLETIAAILVALPNIPDDSVTLASGGVLTTIASLPHLVGVCLMLASFLNLSASESPARQRYKLRSEIYA